MGASKSIGRELVLILGAVLLLACMVFAADKDPIGAKSIAVIDSQRMDDWGGTPVVAEAGNVTELFINATGITKHWAGFYGNVTGYITLDDGMNYTMYDWRMAEPQGKVYATVRNPPTWANVDCLNYTSAFNQTGLEKNLSMEINDEDGVNETFCPGCGLGKDNVGVQHAEFWVGYKKFTYNDCWATSTYVNDDPQAIEFVEVLLQDRISAVYMTIIEDDTVNVKGKKNGFDNRLHDFQLMVGENGNGTNMLTTTTYYFYVELE